MKQNLRYWTSCLAALLNICLFAETRTSITSFITGEYYLIDCYCDTGYYAMSGGVSNKVVSAIRVNNGVTKNIDGTLTIDLESGLFSDAMKYTLTQVGDSIEITNGSPTARICLKAGGNDLNATTGFRWKSVTPYPKDSAGYNKRFLIATRGTNSKGNATDNCLLLCHSTYSNKTLSYKPQFKGYVLSNRDTQKANSNTYGSGYFYLIPTSAGTSTYTAEIADDLENGSIKKR